MFGTGDCAIEQPIWSIPCFDGFVQDNAPLEGVCSLHTDAGQCVCGNGRNGIAFGTSWANPPAMLRSVLKRMRAAIRFGWSPRSWRSHACMPSTPSPVTRHNTLGLTTPSKGIVGPKVLMFIIRDGLVNMQTEDAPRLGAQSEPTRCVHPLPPTAKQHMRVSNPMSCFVLLECVRTSFAHPAPQPVRFRQRGAPTARLPRARFPSIRSAEDRAPQVDRREGFADRRVARSAREAGLDPGESTSGARRIRSLRSASGIWSNNSSSAIFWVRRRRPRRRSL